MSGAFRQLQFNLLAWYIRSGKMQFCSNPIGAPYSMLRAPRGPATSKGMLTATDGQCSVQ